MMFSMGRYLAGLTTAVLLLSGCGGSQSQSSGVSTIPQARKVAKTATSDDLIYATGGCDGTCVLSYPAMELVQSLPGIGNAGACADATGNVYIANGGSLYEYAHGGSAPINTFSSGGSANGCSIDAATGNVAITVGETSDYNVAIFSSPSGPPVKYLIPFPVEYCGYDASGNLFVDGYGSFLSLYELPKSASQFVKLSISPSLSVRPGQVQWDGKHITIEGIGAHSGVTLYRLSVSGSTATVVGTTNFKGVERSALQSWIYGKHIFIPYGHPGGGVKNTQVGAWKYPKGGKVARNRHFKGQPNFQAVTFSAGSKSVLRP